MGLECSSQITRMNKYHLEIARKRRKWVLLLDVDTSVLLFRAGFKPYEIESLSLFRKLPL